MGSVRGFEALAAYYGHAVLADELGARRQRHRHGEELVLGALPYMERRHLGVLPVDIEGEVPIGRTAADADGLKAQAAAGLGQRDGGAQPAGFDDRRVGVHRNDVKALLEEINAAMQADEAAQVWARRRAGEGRGVRKDGHSRVFSRVEADVKDRAAPRRCRRRSPVRVVSAFGSEPPLAQRLE